MQNRTVAGVLSLSVAWASAVSAEDARVRLVTRPSTPSGLPGRLAGVLVASGPDSVTVRTDERGEVVVARTDLWRMDRSLGKRTPGQGLERGALIGLGVGILSGAAVGYALGDDTRVVFYDGGLAFPTSPCPGFCGPYEAPDYTSRHDSAARYAAVAGAVGGLLGALIGRAHPGERWQRETPGGPSVTLELQPAGVGARLAIGF